MLEQHLGSRYRKDVIREWTIKINFRFGFVALSRKGTGLQHHPCLVRSVKYLALTGEKTHV